MATVYNPAIVTDGLVLCLDAGNTKSYPGSGTAWNDLSGRSNNGTLTNGPTYSSSNGGSVVFDGTNDFVSVTGSITTTEATFLSWINRNGTQVAWSGLLFSRSTNVTGINFRSNTHEIGYHWNAEGASGASTYDWASSLIIPDAQWCMVCVSVNSTAAIAYLCTSSGISSATNTLSHTSTTINTIRLAHDPAPASSRYYKGNMSTSMLYNRALSAAEVRQNFNALRGRFGL